jgi:hypothetical protein
MIGDVSHRLDVRHPRVDQEQVQRSFADDLEGEMLAAPSERWRVL